MALTRAQYLSGNSANGVVLVSQPQGVLPGGSGITITTDGTISVNPDTITGVVKLNNPSAYNSYAWPAAAPLTTALLTSNSAGQLSWTSTSGGDIGTVTSIDVSGGTTGLVFSGGPVTTTGVITMSGVLGVANGGTGSTTPGGSINNLLPPQSGNNGYFLTTNGTDASWVNPSTVAVTQIIAGSNITISPTTGRGAVTINSTGGGGGGGGLTGLQEIDDISGLFNGSTVSFPIAISGGQPIPAGPGTSQLVISVGGILQTPGDAFSFDNATDTITFTSAPPAGVSFAGYVGGNADPILAITTSAPLSGGGTSGTVNIGMAASGVTPGSYISPTITVDAFGRVTAASAGGGGVPTGSILAFFNSTAPTGWTQQTSAVYNDATLRLTTGNGGGTGGSIAFSTLFSSSSAYSGAINITSGSVGDTSLSVAQLASHAHSTAGGGRAGGGAFFVVGPQGPGLGTTAAGSNATHTHTLAGVAATGNFTSNFAVKYLDFIIARKD